MYTKKIIAVYCALASLLSFTGFVFAEESRVAFKPPYGEPDKKVDVTAKAHESWRVYGTKDHVKKEVELPADLDEKRERAWKVFMAVPPRPFTRNEERDFLDLLYYDWLATERDSDGFCYDPTSGRKFHYEFNRGGLMVRDIMEVFERDPRKEYLDWAIAYCEMVVAVKAYPEDNLIDEVTGKLITCWLQPIVQLPGEKTAQLHRLLTKLSKIKESNPKKYAEKVKLYEKYTSMTVTPMMSGSYTSPLISTAEMIYRHPELYDLEVPEFGLPHKRDTGKTYLEKANAFFKAGLEAMEFFSNNPGFWNEELGAYVNPRNLLELKREGLSTNEKEEIKMKANRPEAWNRSFQMLDAQSKLIKMMKALDPEKYGPIIKRYQHQIDANLKCWVDNQDTRKTKRGTSRYWAYAWNDYEKHPNAAEDYGHAAATVGLALTMKSRGCNTLSDAVLHDIANMYLDIAYIPEVKMFGKYILPRETVGSNPMHMSSSLLLSAYHIEYWPEMSQAMYANKSLLEGPSWRLHVWLKMYHAHKAHLKHLKKEKARLASLKVKNNPPKFTKTLPSLKIMGESAPGTVLGTLKAVDPDPGQKVTYWIEDGNYGWVFDIDKDTGELSLRSKRYGSGAPDVKEFAQNPAFVASDFSLKIVAADNGDPRMEDSVTVNVKLKFTPKDISNDLVVAYDFEKLTGTRLPDSSGTNHKAKLIEEKGVFPTQVKGRKNGKAINIRNYGYVEFPKSLINRIKKLDEITISFWTKGFTGSFFAPNKSHFAWLSGLNSNGKRVLFIQPWRTNVLVWSAGIHPKNSWRTDTIKGTLDLDGLQEWNHWIFTKNAKTGDMAVYRNGALVIFENKSWYRLKFKSLETMTLGSKSLYPKEMSVPIDDLKIYSKVFTLADAKALYESEK